MFQLKRYRGIAAVAAGLLVWLAILDISLTAFAGFSGRWLPNAEVPTDTTVYQVTGAKLSQILARPEQVGVGTDHPFGVLLGQSSLGASVDSEALAEYDGLPMRWLNLHGWGSSVNLVGDVAELLFLSGLKPNVVVLGINPFMLIGMNFPTQHALQAADEGKRLKPWIWVYNNRFAVNQAGRVLTHRTKLELCRMFGFGFAAIYPPPSDHSKPSPRKRLTPESPALQAQRLELYRKLGFFEPQRYRPDSSNARTLVKLIRESRKRGAKVCIVLMPESSAFRSQVPVQGERCFAEINRLSFPDDPVPIYDLRDRISDDMFTDVVHPNVDAMRPISMLVGRCVADLLSEHPSPERLRSQGALATGKEGTGPGQTSVR